jgi:hypothetical protein
MTMTTRQIWAVMTPSEREDACLAFWQGSDALSVEAQPRVLHDLAAALRFRDVFLRRLKAEEKARHLRRVIERPSLRRYHDEVLRSWLAVRKTAMLVCFVEAMGMTHDGGIIGDNVPPPDVPTLRKGIEALRARFSPREVAIYMATMMAAGGEFWTALPEAVATEIPDLDAALRAEAAPEAAGTERKIGA